MVRFTVEVVSSSLQATHDHDDISSLFLDRIHLLEFFTLAFRHIDLLLIHLLTLVVIL